MNLFEDVDFFESASDEMRRVGVLSHQITQCPTANDTSEEAHDGVCYRCRNHNGQKQSIREGSFWFNSNLRLSTHLMLAYMWLFKVPVTVAAEFCDISERHSIQRYAYFRQVTSWWLVDRPRQIRLDGEGVTVQTDESVIAKRKYYRGHGAAERWIYSMYDCTTRKGMIRFVEDRSAATLPLIEEYVIPGTTIH